MNLKRFAFLILYMFAVANCFAGYIRIYVDVTRDDTSVYETYYMTTSKGDSTSVSFFPNDNQEQVRIYSEYYSDTWIDSHPLTYTTGWVEIKDASGNVLNHLDFAESVDAQNSYVYLSMSVDPQDVFDEYRWGVFFENYDPLYTVDMYSLITLQGAAGSSFQTVVEPTLLGYQDLVSIDSSLVVAQDSDEQAPTELQTVFTYERDVEVSMQSSPFLIVSGEQTETGGDVYLATMTRVFEVGYNEPVEGPEDLTDPANDPDDPNDTPVLVPPLDGDLIDYDEMRKAVEIALSNRDLSDQQIGDAVQSALNKQGLSSEEIQKAVAAGTKDGTADVESMLDRIEQAIREQDNSVDLSAAGTSAETIAEGVEAASANILDVASNQTLTVTGEDYEATNTNAVPALGSSSDAAIVEANGVYAFIEDWFGSFWTLELPLNIGKSYTILIHLPGAIPTEIFDWPEDILIDISEWTIIDIIRDIELLILNVCMLFAMAAIYRGAW